MIKRTSKLCFQLYIIIKKQKHFTINTDYNQGDTSSLQPAPSSTSVSAGAGGSGVAATLSTPVLNPSLRFHTKSLCRLQRVWTNQLPHDITLNQSQFSTDVNNMCCLQQVCILDQSFIQIPFSSTTHYTNSVTSKQSLHKLCQLQPLITQITSPLINHTRYDVIVLRPSV